MACVPVASAQQPAVRKDSIAADPAIGDQRLRLYLSPIRVDSGYRLTPYGYSGATHIQQTVDFAERTESSHVGPVVGVATRTIDTSYGLQFVSPVLAGPFELSGDFSGRLELITNKPDFDFRISLYELTASGDYVLISTYSRRPGTTLEPAHRTLLEPGVRQHLDYQSDRLGSRVIQNGSRLLVLITILEQGDAATGYAAYSGGDGTMVDVREPLRIRWYGQSYIELQVRRR